MLSRNPARFLSTLQRSGLIAQRAEVTLRPKSTTLNPDESIGLYVDGQLVMSYSTVSEGLADLQSLYAALEVSV